MTTVTAAGYLRVSGTEDERFDARVASGKPDDCWIWTGYVNPRGYGRFTRSLAEHGGRKVLAHRFAYERIFGIVPLNLQLDHTCHSADTACLDGDRCQHRRCVNPAHLEPVTNRENSHRGRVVLAHALRRAERTHCRRGHEYSERDRDAHGYRRCRTCHEDRRRERLGQQPRG